MGDGDRLRCLTSPLHLPRKGVTEVQVSELRCHLFSDKFSDVFGFVQTPDV